MRFLRSWWWLLLIPVVLGLARLRFDVEVLNLLPGELPVVQGLKRYQQAFADARELIVTVEASTAEEAEAAARMFATRLRSQTGLVARMTWQPVWMENPSLSTEILASLWINQPPELFTNVTWRLNPRNRASVLEESRQLLTTSLSPSQIGMRSYDPYGLMQLPESAMQGVPSIGSGDELFSASEGKLRLMFIEAKPDILSYRECLKWLVSIRAEMQAVMDQPDFPKGVVWHATGRPAFVTEIAGGMESDMTGSAGGTLATIGILFWLTHRRLRPLVWLLVLLVALLAGTTAFGGLLLGGLNVVSLGFASILLGLAEDYGIVIYQESRSHPELDETALRREVAPGIFWSTVTTAGAFLILNLSALPGLAQLGSLVAIGIVLAAVVMLYGYLPVVLRLRRTSDRESLDPAKTESYLLFSAGRLLPSGVIWGITLLLLFASISGLVLNGVRFDASPNVLKPKRSEANATLETIKKAFSRDREPLWILVPGDDEQQVAAKLRQVLQTLQTAQSNQWIAGFTLPVALWPNPEHQRSNRVAIASALADRQGIRESALAAGFTATSLAATDSLLDAWRSAGEGDASKVYWPTNPVSRWILGKVTSRTDGHFLALGLVHPTAVKSDIGKLVAAWPEALSREGVTLSGWELLGSTVFQMVIHELPRMLVPILILVVVSLWLAFRNVREVLLSLGTLAFGGLCLNVAMQWLGWDWNLLNLMALPLLLGMGVDFSIHIQLALKRYEGDLLQVRKSVGRALLLAGATTVAGFASLAFSSNAGMASLGSVCALGILIALLIAVYLLPVWWKVGARRDVR